MYTHPPSIGSHLGRCSQYAYTLKLAALIERIIPRYAAVLISSVGRGDYLLLHIVAEINELNYAKNKNQFFVSSMHAYVFD